MTANWEPNTWYYTYRVVNEIGSNDCLVSKDPNKATKNGTESGPGVYRLSAFHTDAEGHIRMFARIGDEFKF